jgi:hypothetical protein
LRREVIAPRQPSSSFGLIAVSTLAMLFAVSSSLLLFSAHRQRVCVDRAHPSMVRASRVDSAPVVGPARAECKGPVYRSTGDGRTEVVFEQCPARPFAAD